MNDQLLFIYSTLNNISINLYVKISKSKYGSCVDRTIVFLFNVLSDVSRAADNRVTNVGSSFYAGILSKGYQRETALPGCFCPTRALRLVDELHYRRCPHGRRHRHFPDRSRPGEGHFSRSRPPTANG